jgi:ABC-type amino acid transport substrate-binding protein
MPKLAPLALAASLALTFAGALALAPAATLAQAAPPAAPTEAAPSAGAAAAEGSSASTAPVAAPESAQPPAASPAAAPRLPGAAAAPEPRELRVGVLDNAPPFSSRGRFGNRDGFDVDIALALCSRLNATCTITPFAAEDLAAAFDERRIDFAVATLTPARLDGKVDFTNPYVRIAGRFVVPSAGVPEGVDAWGVVAGSAQAEDFVRVEPQRAVSLYATAEEMWIDLSLGRLAGVLAPAIMARRDFLATPIGEGFRFEQTADPEALSRTAAIAVRQGNDALRSAIDGALADLLAAPEYADILSRHLDGDLAEPPST